MNILEAIGLLAVIAGTFYLITALGDTFTRWYKMKKSRYHPGSFFLYIKSILVTEWVVATTNLKVEMVTG